MFHVADARPCELILGDPGSGLRFWLSPSALAMRKTLARLLEVKRRCRDWYRQGFDISGCLDLRDFGGQKM